MTRYVRTSITIREDQLAWVRKNNALNLSGLVQDVIDDMMAMRQEHDQDEHRTERKEMNRDDRFDDSCET
jgi:hypothetical protein